MVSISPAEMGLAEHAACCCCESLAAGELPSCQGSALPVEPKPRKYIHGCPDTHVKPSGTIFSVCLIQVGGDAPATKQGACRVNEDTGGFVKPTTMILAIVCVEGLSRHTKHILSNRQQHSQHSELLLRHQRYFLERHSTESAGVSSIVFTLE